MNAIAKVFIWNHFVGAVMWDEKRKYASFEFDPSFIDKKLDIAPLTMPLKRLQAGERKFSFPTLNKESFRGLPGLLSDSLPDKFGNRIIDAWLKRNKKDAANFNPVNRLCYIGARGMGALEFEPSIGEKYEINDIIEINELIKLTRDILDSKKKLRTNLSKKANKALSEIISVGTSAGGARAKGIIAYNEKTGEVRTGQSEAPEGFEHWIIKFDGVTNEKLGDPKGYGRIEYAYHLMAKACGIEMTECRLLKEHNRAHFMTKRFDRENGEKLHMQSLCAIAHYDYNDSYSWSYEDAFRVILKLNLGYPALEQLFRRMVFNVIARNQDDHTKNISFLMNSKGKWKLAPAYDVTYAYDPANIWMKAHQMSINGKNENIDRSDILSLAKEMDIKKAKAILEEMKLVIKKWKKFAADADVATTQVNAIGKTHLPMLHQM
jgi:serine/threonine-protein kinase HipA